MLSGPYTSDRIGRCSIAVVAHHALLQAAMKAKQSVDTKTSDELSHAIDHIAVMYTK